MKRLYLLIAAALLCAALYSVDARRNAPAAAAGLTYGYLAADTVLYAAAAAGYVAQYTLPRTYFVAIVGEDKDGYTAVSWLDASGFVKTDELEPVDYTPVTKYPSRSLTAANDRNPVNVRSAPDHTADNIVGTIPDGQTAAVYGETDGTELIPQVGGRWYYVRYSANDLSVYGYVYAAQVAVEPLTDNVVERETPVVTEPIEEQTELGLYAKLGVIAALTVPAVVVMFIIFRPAPADRKSRKL